MRYTCIYRIVTHRYYNLDWIECGSKAIINVQEYRGGPGAKGAFPES